MEAGTGKSRYQAGCFQRGAGAHRYLADELGALEWKGLAWPGYGGGP